MYRISAVYLPRDGMFFDTAHYESVHIPLVRLQLEGQVGYTRMEAEFDVVLLDDGKVRVSPCVFALYVKTEADVEDFRRFRKSVHVAPLREDLPRYTNCANEWRVSRLVEG